MATRGKDSSSTVLGWAATASASSCSRLAISVSSRLIWTMDPRMIASRTFGAMGLGGGRCSEPPDEFGCRLAARVVVPMAELAHPAFAEKCCPLWDGIVGRKCWCDLGCQLLQYLCRVWPVLGQDGPQLVRGRRACLDQRGSCANERDKFPSGLSVSPLIAHATTESACTSIDIRGLIHHGGFLQCSPCRSRLRLLDQPTATCKRGPGPERADLQTNLFN